MILPCTQKQLAWAAWRRGDDVVGQVELLRFEAWWAKVVAGQPMKVG